jgi:glycosyltransferase involved in cell wall biosynthesis
MKILIVHNYYQQPGGEDHCLAAEVAMLEANGHEVITYRISNDAIDGMNRLRLAARTIWSRGAYREVRGLIRKHRPRIAHFHNTFPLISPAGYYAAQVENVRVVQTLHNYRLLCPNALFFREGRVCEDCLGRTFPWPGIVHKCYRGNRAASAATATMLAVHRAKGTWRGAVDVYIALTEFGRQKFIAGGLPTDKIVVKPNFVYPDPGPGAGEGGYAIFVGRLSAEKGVHTLLKAWKNLRGAMPLKIVGDGPLAATVSAAAAEDAGIQWLGSQPSEAVYSLIGGATFLVLPSECYETFGRVGIEAFAKGTPVLASRLGAMAEVVDHGRTGLHFEPGDARDLALKAQQFLSEPQPVKRMRQAARQEYERKYTAATNYRLLMAIYEQSLGAEPMNWRSAMNLSRRDCSPSGEPKQLLGGPS